MGQLHYKMLSIPIAHGTWQSQGQPQPDCTTGNPGCPWQRNCHTGIILPWCTDLAPIQPWEMVHCSLSFKSPASGLWEGKVLASEPPWSL